MLKGNQMIIIVLGDFNGYVEKCLNRYKGVYGGQGWGNKNKDRERLLEFADSFDIYGN